MKSAKSPGGKKGTKKVRGPKKKGASEGEKVG